MAKSRGARIQASPAMEIRREPGRRWSRNPLVVAMTQPPSAMGLNHATSWRGLAPMMSVMLDAVRLWSECKGWQVARKELTRRCCKEEKHQDCHMRRGAQPQAASSI